MMSIKKVTKESSITVSLKQPEMIKTTQAHKPVNPQFCQYYGPKGGTTKPEPSRG